MSRALGIHLKSNTKLSGVSISMKLEPLISAVVMIGISAIILQLVLFLRLWMKLRQRKKHTRPSLRISCEQAKRCSLQRTTRTASKQRTTISSAKSPLVLAPTFTNVVSSFERFMPEAPVDDGYMRIIIFKEYFILDILSVLPLIISGAIYNSRYTTTLTVKKLISNFYLTSMIYRLIWMVMQVRICLWILKYCHAYLKVFCTCKTQKKKP